MPIEIFTDKEVAVTLPGPSGSLEAVAQGGKASGEFADQGLMALVCHPHSLHGGTMNNKVVTTLVRLYRDLGIPVLRFNFRGVGQSEGVFDDAVGEVDDALAVVEWMNQQLPGRRLLLAGFSFGSSVAAQASYRLAEDASLPALVQLTLVAPPVERYPYDQDGSFTCPLCVVQGDKDELVAAEGVYQWLQTLQSPAELIRIDDACHFFHGKLGVVKRELVSVLQKQLADTSKNALFTR